METTTTTTKNTNIINNNNSPAAFFQLNGFILSQYFINAFKKFMIMIFISLKTERKQRIRVFLDLIKY